MTEYSVMSLNILSDQMPPLIYQPFRKRIRVTNEIVKKYDPDIIGVQELTKTMFFDLMELSKAYIFCGEYRLSVMHNESCPILFKRGKFQYLGTNTLWLSQTPEIKCSRFAKSQFPRIVTYVYLKDLETDHIFTCFNTHLDANFASVRALQAEVLSSIILEKQKGDFTILTGDMNATSEEDALSILSKTGMKDLVPDTLGSTLRGKIGSRRAHQLPIDHIFVSRNMIASNIKKITESTKGIYPSDHYPVIAYLNV